MSTSFVNRKARRQSYHEYLTRIAEEFIDQTGRTTYTTKEIAAWAIRTGKWTPPPDLALQKCRQDFARAFREEFIKDEFGRPVRAKHVARITQGDRQLHIWADIRSAPEEHMDDAFSQRREQIVGDCRQLKRDIDYYNSLHPERRTVQLVLDFTDDVAEGEMPAEYPPRKPR